MPSLLSGCLNAMYVLLFVVVILLIAGIIVLLHRGQLRSRKDIAERTAPLGSIDLSFSAAPPAGAERGQEAEVSPPQERPAAVEAPAAAATSTAEDELAESWLEQVRRLREEQHPEAALAICRRNYPRVQAFQQAAIILRQRIRENIERNTAVSTELKELYRVAVLADLYRNSNPHKPRDPEQAWRGLQDMAFDYRSIGSRQLRLLTKSDVRHLEQLWGKPEQHRHTEEALDAEWRNLCL